MPTYEYQCSACSKHIEKFQKINDEPLLTCPYCSEDKLERQLSASGFQLKGTGWYVTDFRNKGKPANKPEEQQADTNEKKSTEKVPAKNEVSSNTKDNQQATKQG